MVLKTRLLCYNKRILNTQTLPSPAFNENVLSSPSKIPSQSSSQVILQWWAHSHHNQERSPRWYVKAAVVVLAIAGYAILTGTWSLALVAILLGGLYFLSRKSETPLKNIAIERDGVRFQDSFIPWTQCKDFWMAATPLYTELHISKSSGLTREISIQTGDLDPSEIRATLSQFIPMRPDQREKLLDAFIRICKL